jgi:signal transduction histidine kinase
VQSADAGAARGVEGPRRGAQAYGEVTLTDLPELLDRAVDRAAEAMRECGVRCVVDGSRPLHVKADAHMLGQAVLNLLLHAADATGACGGGTVTVRFGRPPEGSAARQFHLVVRDTGPGIPPQVLDRIFDPFFDTAGGGSGRRLPIVRRVVEAHDGTVTACNCDGGGARFEIRI